MSQCLRILFVMEISADFLQDFIQKHARALGLEGTAQQVASNKVRIVACGPKKSMDDFVDLLHKKGAQGAMEYIEIEPFLKDKDYRGVFRVIE